MTNQNDLQAVIERAKADIAKKYVFVHMPILMLETLIAGFEDLQRENERMKEALEWYAEDSNYNIFANVTAILERGNRARNVLYTLKCTP